MCVRGFQHGDWRFWPICITKICTSYSGHGSWHIRRVAVMDFKPCVTQIDQYIFLFFNIYFPDQLRITSFYIYILVYNKYNNSVMVQPHRVWKLKPVVLVRVLIVLINPSRDHTWILLTLTLLLLFTMPSTWEVLIHRRRAVRRPSV